MKGRKVFVDTSTIDLFVDSMIEIMEVEPQRIKEKNENQFIDTKTNVTLFLDKEEWILDVPDGRNFILQDDQVKKILQGLNNRENSLLLEKHKVLFSGEDMYKIFIGIQKCRDKPMVEEAWQNLLTIYALNMDGDNNVS